MYEEDGSKLYDMGYNDFTSGKKPRFPGDDEYMQGFYDAKEEFTGLSIEDAGELEEREKIENEEGWDGYSEDASDEDPEEEPEE